MKVVQFTKHGDRGVLEYGNFPELEVDPDGVLVDVKAALLNHPDTWTRWGPPSVELGMPRILGSDVAGVVTEAGECVTRFEVGDHAALIAGVVGGGDEFLRRGDPTFAPNFHIIGEHVRGVHAEPAATSGENLVSIPEGVPWEVAGFASFAFQTVWWMFVDCGELRPGEKALVPGAFDGVSHAAVQIADYAGAEVYVTASTDEKLEYAEECGVDCVISYEEDDFSKEIRTLTDGRGVDMVVDHIGEATYKQSLKSLIKGDRVVTCGVATGPNPGTGLNYIFWNQFSVIGSTMATPGEADEVLDLVRDGTFEPRIRETLLMNEIDRAHELIEERQGSGKVVVIPDSEL